MSLNDVTGGCAGYTCSGCGMWTPYNGTHRCYTPPPYIPPPLQQGWKCPNCNSAHAPSVLTCPNKPAYCGAMWGGINNLGGT